MGYEFDWGLPFRKPYIDWLISGLWLTALLTLVTTAGSFSLGIVAADFRLARYRLAKLISIVFVEVFRNIPTLFWLFFFFFVLPEVADSHLGVKLNRWPGLPLAAACFALILSNGAHVAEIIRSGVQSIPKNQQAAALSLGLSPLRVSWSITLPQALRVSLPALGPRMVHNFHNTSLALVISVRELTWQTQQIESYTFRGFEAVTVATLVFVSLSLLMTVGFRLLERWGSRWSLSLS